MLIAILLGKLKFRVKSKNSSLQYKSVNEQVQNLRNSLKGLTEDNKKVIENKEVHRE